ncbi:MAG: hypothetical protein ACRDS9_14270 [Pseudonocardiaceae bacterium]
MRQVTTLTRAWVRVFPKFSEPCRQRLGLGRLPAWDAAHHEIRGHIALASGDVTESRALFATAADGYTAAGQPLDQRRCAELAKARSKITGH